MVRLFYENGRIAEIKSPFDSESVWENVSPPIDKITSLIKYFESALEIADSMDGKSVCMSLSADTEMIGIIIDALRDKQRGDGGCAGCDAETVIGGGG